MSSFYTNEELNNLGFKSLGKNVQISRKASFYGIKTIEIGNNVRIDDFCIISGHVKIGSYIHISAYVSLYGSNGIILEDYTGISPRSTIYSAMDDFSGHFLVGPIHPKETTCVTGGCVIVKQFSHIGCNCVIFPNITIGEGAVVGAMSLVNKDLKPWGIYYGVPCSFFKSRENKLKVIAEKYYPHKDPRK